MVWPKIDTTTNQSIMLILECHYCNLTFIPYQNDQYLCTGCALMKGRTPSKDEKEWMDSAAKLGCIVCLEFYDTYSPASIHHIDGKTKKGAHMLTIPLCARHHQVACPTGSYATRHGPGRNTGKRAFKEAYTTEDELLERAKDRIYDRT